MTIPAQMLMSCVKRTGERFGLAYVIDVLRGSSDQRIRRAGHDQLSTWGIGKDRSKAEWQYIGRTLIREGYLHQDAANFNVVSITRRGADVLFRGETVSFAKPPAPARTTAATDHDTAHPELFERLRQLRKRIADERGVPPYVVFPDTTLRQMSARLPQTEHDILRISGVGERKASTYGAAFTALISAFVSETGATPQDAPARVAPPRRQSLSPTARTSLELFNAGRTIDDVATERGLAATTIEAHLVEAIESGATVNVHHVVSDAMIEEVSAAIQRVGDELLRPIMDELGEDSGYSWGDLRLIRAWLRQRAVDTRTPPA